MRRFHSDHEGVIPNEDVLLLWKCDEGSASTGLLDSAYSATFSLISVGSVPLQKGLFSGASANSRQCPNTAGAGWFISASAASIHLAVATDWSIGLWYQIGSTAATSPILEYSTTSTTLDASLMPLGLYQLPSNVFRIQYDLSSTSVANTIDMNVPALTAGVHHIALTREAFNSHAGRFNLYIDGVLSGTATSELAVANGTRYSNGKWIVGASARWPTSATSPGYSTGARQFDDIVMFKRTVSAQKINELVGNGLRPWNERRLQDSNNHRTFCRISVEGPDGTMIDLSALYGFNWIQSVDIKQDVDAPADRASVKLNRVRGNTLNLSPLSQDSVLNQNAQLQFSAMLDLRRKVRIDVAYVPGEWNIQGWEWATAFDGFIDSIGWETDSVSIECIDKMAPLQDQFQLDPIAYDYYTVQTLAETHIQNVILANIPRLATSYSTSNNNSVLTFGYKGGTPTLFTPASSGWVLNYDDTPSGQVDQIVQSIADQIGWDCRYKWFDPWQEFRLTFFAPPRLLSLDIKSISKDAASGNTLITFTRDHGLTEDQSITIAGTTNFNGTTTIQTVVGYNQVLTYQAPGGSPATETVGTVTYSAAYTFPDTMVSSFDEISKDTSDIRNAAVVLFKRDNTAVTLPIINFVTAGAGNALNVIVSSSPAFAKTIQQFAVGQTVTILPDGAGSTTATNAVGTWSIGTFSTVSLNTFGTNEFVAGAASGTTGVLSTEYITRRSVYSCNTVSIARYGLRQAAVYEGSSGNIDTDREAQALADAIVNDLADPTANMTMKVRCAPWLELHDLLTLSPDKKQRWTVAQNMAVVGLNHHFANGDCYTQVSMRNASPTLGTVWVARIKQGAQRPANIDHMVSEMTSSLSGFGISNRHAHAIGFTSHPEHTWSPKGSRRRLRNDRLEVHVSTASGFIPTAASTLWGLSRGNHFEVSQDPIGNPITPGLTHYVRFRGRDILNNLGGYTDQQTVVPRYSPLPAAARACLINSGSVMWQTTGTWLPFAFSDDTSSPCFDTFGNFQPGPNSAFSMAANVSGQVTHAFRMPCDGLCNYEARLGVRNVGTTKSTAAVGIGLFRSGSSIPGFNASLPFTTASLGSVASTNLGSFAVMQGQISAFSGDYIHFGVNTDATIFSVSAANTSSASLSWAKFSVQQD